MNSENIKLETYPDPIEYNYEFIAPKGLKPVRLDVYLTKIVENATRNKVQTAIDNKRVIVNGNPAKASYKLRPYDEIKCTIMKAPPLELIPQEIPLDIIYEDDYLLVINKQFGLCVHPGVGNRYGTLVNGLLHHFGIKENIHIDIEDDEDDEFQENRIFGNEQIRPGIVHRIDKNTSGLLVIAKNNDILFKLSKQFAARTTEREYNALVWGVMKEDEGRIEGNIGRSTLDRKKFAVLQKGGKEAITDYKVLKRFNFATLVKYKLHTGRTHQIRVHSSHIKHPLIGDEMYGGEKILFGGNLPQFKSMAVRTLKIATRQMLHAKTLGFEHPVNKSFMHFDSDLPSDMLELIEMYEQKMKES
jgi:23S rRNA pseudouridine1911/1915/1917 synthase